MATETIIFVGVAIYMVMMIGIGLYASKKSHSVTDFMVAGRGLPTALLTMTVIATWFGGSTIMGGAGAAYDEGMLGVIEDPWGGALAIILIGLFFVRTFHRLKIITVADFMEMRFGRVAGIAIMCVTIFANTVWVGSMLVAFGLIFFSLTGIPLEVGVIAERAGAELSDDVELALECVAFYAVSRPDKKLFHYRHGGARSRAHIGDIGLYRHASPTQ